jgi:hypothetical protein
VILRACKNALHCALELLIVSAWHHMMGKNIFSLRRGKAKILDAPNVQQTGDVPVGVRHGFAERTRVVTYHGARR